jgi:hypothetical protein
MANKDLFLTSYFMLIMHSFAIFIYQPPFIIFITYIIGPLVSVWNHGTSSIIAQIIDRSVMVLGYLIDLSYIYKLKNIYVFIIIHLAIISYFIAKITKITSFHLLAHFLIIITHIILLYYYYNYYFYKAKNDLKKVQNYP